jgi:hypothetical protein
MAPRPDTDEVKEIIETETNMHWTVHTDEPDKLSFVAISYKFDIIWHGDHWTFKIFDKASSYGDEEPRWAEGPMANATEIKTSLPGFIPHEIRV